MTHRTQLTTAVAAAVPGNTFASSSAAQQELFTVEQFAAVERSFSAAALRNLIFKAQSRYSSRGIVPGNGLLECGGVVRVGRKVLIHRAKFLTWVQQ